MKDNSKVSSFDLRTVYISSSSRFGLWKSVSETALSPTLLSAQISAAGYIGWEYMFFVRNIKKTSNITTMTYNDPHPLTPIRGPPESLDITTRWECQGACKIGQVIIMASFFSLLVCLQLYFILAWRQRLRVLREHTRSEPLVQKVLPRRVSLSSAAKEARVGDESPNVATKLD